MTTERLHEFRVLANTLNYSKAADTLYMTQSVLSRHIKDLEKELGVQLFYRNTHQVSLTDAGLLLLNNCQKIIREADNVSSLLRTSKLGADGSIHIGYSEQTLSTPVVGFLHEFTRKYPNIVLHHEPLSTNIPGDYLNNYDILFSPCEYTHIAPEIKSQFLLSQRALLALPPNYHLNAVQYISLEELRDETLIVPYSDELFGPYARNALLTTRLNRGHINQISAPTAQSALLMVELSQGISIIPHHLRHMAYKHTRVIGISNPECKFDIFIYNNTNRENSTANLFFESAVSYFNNLFSDN